MARWKGVTVPYLTERVIAFLSMYLVQTLSVSHQTEAKTSENQKLPPDTEDEAKRPIWLKYPHNPGVSPLTSTVTEPPQNHS